METLEKYLLLKELTKELMVQGDIKNYVNMMIALEELKGKLMPFYLCN